MAKLQGLRDSAWSDFFEIYNLVDAIKDAGFADITAQQFHQLHLQPRLHTKMDHRSQVPTIFRQHNLNLLTRSINTWRIGTFDVFQDLPRWELPTKEVANFSFPRHLESLDPSNLTGEPGVIHSASAAGVLEDFCEERLTPTFAGRMRTGEFTYSVNDFNLGQSKIEVSGAQIEIDAAFEGEKSFIVFEVKNHISQDFLVRQLFYPFEVWRRRVKSKPVRTVYLTYANDVYDLFEFAFENGNYSGISLVKQKRYTIDLAKPEREQIVQLAHAKVSKSTNENRSGIPFPQADDFERIMDLVSFISEGPRTLEEIALNYDFHSRQSGYYVNAGKYLGLLENHAEPNGVVRTRVSSLARKMLQLRYREKVLGFARLALDVEPVAQTYLNWCSNGRQPTLDWVAERLVASEVGVTNQGILLADSTIRRRSQTVLSWAKWLILLSEPA